MRMVQVPSHLYILHFAIMLSPAIFALVLYFVVIPGETATTMAKEQIAVFQTIAAVLAVIAVGLSQLVPRFILRNSQRTTAIRGAAESGSGPIPVRKYVSLKIVQWALLEIAALFMGVVYFLTQQRSMLISLGVLIALIALMRPTVDEMLRHNVKD
jgi:hypothetical protein